jgi:hypothetical protein
MSIIEMFRLKNRDERLVAEMNKVYALGYFMLSFGICLDIYYGLSRAQIAFVRDLSVNAFDYVSPVELIVLLLAQIVCLIVQTKRGLTTTNRFVDTNHFPAGYYLILSGMAAIGGGLAAILLRILAEAQMLGATRITGESWLTAGIFGISLTIGVFLAVFILSYVAFKIAKRQEKKNLTIFEEG